MTTTTTTDSNSATTAETPVHVHGPGCNHGHHIHDQTPYVRSAPKVGANDPCPCGSGKKHKKCCRS
jgi:uncharacterized protein YchJ